MTELQRFAIYTAAVAVIVLLNLTGVLPDIPVADWIIK